MSSYVYSFTTASDDISTDSWKEIVLDDSDGGYVHANTGHQAIGISVISEDNVGHTLTLAWVDCDQNKANAILGVTKVDALTATVTTRRTSLDNSSGGYVCTVSAASSSSSIVRTLGIGPCIDLRSSPVNLSKRRLFIGLTTKGAGAGVVTAIITPTKII
jgi:hypothetical protein